LGIPGREEVSKQIANLEAKAAAQAAKQKAEEEKKAKALLAELAVKMIAARKEFARKLETNYLDNGLNIDVTAEGPKAQVLKIKYALTSKVLAHQIEKGDLLETAKTLGFTKVRLTNGFESSLAEGYTWTL
jgi:FKBP-type peptidyl-prolyl cis-trans isomerase